MRAKDGNAGSALRKSRELIVRHFAVDYSNDPLQPVVDR